MKYLSNFYCVYITIYSGNQLPPFYIGYSSYNKIQNNYRGSVSSKQYKIIWQSELKNNPHLFKTIILSYHNSRKEAAEKEEYIQNFFSVHKNPMYINKAIGNKKFFNNGGYKHTEESKKKINYWKGKQLPLTAKRKKSIIMKKKMKGFKHTEESKKKIGLGRIGKLHTEETKAKISNLHSHNEYTISLPNNTIIITKKLNEFCKIHNISACTLRLAYRENRIPKSGYAILNIKQLG